MMMNHTSSYLRHLKYITNKDGKTFLVRPLDYRSPRCEVLEYMRYDFNEVESISTLLRDIVSTDYPKKGCVVASFVLSYLINSESLFPYRGIDNDGENHWWLENDTTGLKYDLTDYQYDKDELKMIYKSGRKSRLYSYQSKPQKRFFDTIQKIQPSSVISVLDNSPKEFCI